MYRLLRPLLFRIDPERAHGLTLQMLQAAAGFPIGLRLLDRMFGLDDVRLRIDALGMTFKNPVGLAAGYDKNALAVRGLSALGFGHVELGTVTVLPQPGNPRPRIHRISQARGLINSMGFPNAGVAELLDAPAIRAVPGDTGTSEPRVHLGINVGKGKDTSLEKAADDYCALIAKVCAYADYIALNISSPNTVGLRQLQARDAMESLLKAVIEERNRYYRRVPLLVKIAPDLSEAEIENVVAAVTAGGADGIIATNTTIGRQGVPPQYAALKGGLSGAPLRERANTVMCHLARLTGGKLPLIGAGGVMSASDALERLRAGAWLVQVYTGLIYEGPGLVRQINAGLLQACEREGAKSVWELARR
jgi:dihydroorotate dehydrogenase